MAGGAADGSGSLAQTPTWAVALVCAVIVLISLSLEKVLHHLGEFLARKQKKAMYEALQKVKSELMILGFISLLLTFGQNYIAKICVPQGVARTMWPCHESDTNGRRGLLFNSVLPGMASTHRMLAAGGETVSCAEGKVPLLTTTGVHQLHIFIFFLAVFHVAYSASTMGLGRAKIRSWKEWEKHTLSPNYEFTNDPSRFRFAHEISFVRQHAHFWTRISLLFYMVCFFRQFFRSVRKVDYLTMRHGFVTVHLSPGAKFDFQKYIKRSLEDDFKVLVGISPLLWATTVMVMLINVQGSNALLWMTLIPLVILLAVGTKLQAIIARMALEIQERHAVVQGMPVVLLSDKQFWFGKPGLVLKLIHFTLFLNAFQITYFFWIWYSFSLKSCFHERLRLTIGRVLLGVFVQFLCSYITLPLYALVTQMGSHMKRSVFDEQTSEALKKWHQAAKKKCQQSTNASPATSPVHPLQRFMTAGHAARSVKLGKVNTYYSDQDASDIELDAGALPRRASATVLISEDDQHGVQPNAEQQVERSKNDDSFSFAKV